MRRSHIFATVALVLTAACGEVTPPESPLARRIEACDLLSGGDLTEIAGLRFAAGARGDPRGGRPGEAYASSCAFATARADGQTGQEAFRSAIYVTLTVWSWRDEDAAIAFMLQADALVGAPSEPASGIGDEAAWSGALYARAGAVNLVITPRGVAPLAPERAKAIAQGAAKAAIGALARPRQGSLNTAD